MKNETTQKMMDFIKKSPTAYHVVQNLKEEMINKGFEQLSEKDNWTIIPGKKYFVIRNGTAIISFEVPGEDFNGFNIVASHSDSPCFKVKENPDMYNCGIYRINVEKYGGMLLNPWFDRALSIAGRVITSETDGNKIKIKSTLVNVDKDLLVIPNLAIHMNRDANNGRSIDVQSEMMPVCSTEKDFNFKSMIAKAAGVETENIQSYDLFLYNRDEPKYIGEKDEFILSPRLDDLECVYSTFRGFFNACNTNDLPSKVLVHAVFDNEEVGSQSMQGAGSTFLYDVLKRISCCMNHNEQEYIRDVANSFLVSADNAHGVHPNYSSSADPNNRPELNKGIVIKYNAAQKYTTDGVSASFFKKVCEIAKVPYQIFTNNSNVPGGSTLGNISTSQVSVKSVDIGLAQWAMHSPNETAGADDPVFMEKAIETFYISNINIEE